MYAVYKNFKNSLRFILNKRLTTIYKINKNIEVKKYAYRLKTYSREISIINYFIEKEIEYKKKIMYRFIIFTN